jgi:hypothetical protein
MLDFVKIFPEFNGDTEDQPGHSTRDTNVV